MVADQALPAKPQSPPNHSSGLGWPEEHDDVRIGDALEA